MNLIQIEQRNKIQSLAKNIVKKHFGIDIENNTRKREYILARSMYYKLLRENTKMSFQEIANIFKKDHATVLHSIKQLNGYMEYDVTLRADYAAIHSTFLDAIDNDLLDKYNGENPETTPEYLKLLQDFNELKKRYLDLKHDHQILVEASSVLNEKFKTLTDKHEAREKYYARNGFIIG